LHKLDLEKHVLHKLFGWRSAFTESCFDCIVVWLKKHVSEISKEKLMVLCSSCLNSDSRQNLDLLLDLSLWIASWVSLSFPI